MSIKIMTAVWDTGIGPATRRLILLALADIVNDDGEGWPSIDTLARRAHCSRTAAEDSLRSLAADGIITRESRGYNKSNLYRINLATLTPEIRGGPSPLDPRDPGEGPPGSGGGTPGITGTEPSVEPSIEPKPSKDSRSAGADHASADLFDTPSLPGVEPPAPTRPRKGSRTSNPDPDGQLFDQFWVGYPRKIGKGQARKAWGAAIKKVDARAIVNATQRFAASRKGEDPQFTPHPATWLNGERWNDEPEYARNGSGTGGDTRGSGGYRKHFEHIPDDDYAVPAGYRGNQQ